MNHENHKNAFYVLTLSPSELCTDQCNSYLQ